MVVGGKKTNNEPGNAVQDAGEHEHAAFHHQPGGLGLWESLRGLRRGGDAARSSVLVVPGQCVRVQRYFPIVLAGTRWTEESTTSTLHPGTVRASPNPF